MTLKNQENVQEERKKERTYKPDRTNCSVTSEKERPNNKQGDYVLEPTATKAVAGPLTQVTDPGSDL